MGRHNVDKTGYTNINNQGLKMTIIAYRNYRDIDIRFDDGTILYNKKCDNFYSGKIKNKNYKDTRLKDTTGEIHKLNCGATAKIINYINSKNVDVFIIETGEIMKNVEIGNLKKGNVRPLFYPRIRGVGYLGEYFDKNESKNKCYCTWNRMLERCYDEKFHIKHTTYKGCSVCEEWHNYSNFKKWYKDNYYEIEGETIALDKDILIKGNKIYSPETCVFVPERINSLFTKRNVARGEFPIGVSKDITTYRVSMSMLDSNRVVITKGINTPEEAFCVYKQVKEQYIKQVADEYKERIPKILYDTMYKYEVEITD